MTNASGANASQQGLQLEAQQVLAEYLELSLDAGASLIVMRHSNDIATLYIGDASGPREELKRRGTIAAALANEMLNVTDAGMNLLEIEGKTYRFFRSFTHVDNVAAVVFSSM
jgi:nucleoside-diphosphate-sugar epimerase